jgi:hypothetical protein
MLSPWEMAEGLRSLQEERVRAQVVPPPQDIQFVEGLSLESIAALKARGSTKPPVATHLDGR